MNGSRSRPRTEAEPGLLMVVPARAPDDGASSEAPAVELRLGAERCDGGTGNVVSLAHVRAEREHASCGQTAPVEPPCAEDRPVPPRHSGAGRRSILMAACSVILHAAVLAAFAREPAPVASIGLEVISVEMVLGADSLAGLAPDPGESETTSAAASGEPEPDPDPKPEPPEKAAEPPPAPKPVEEAEAPAPEPVPEEPPPVEQQVAVAPPPDPVPEPPKAEEPPPPEPAPVIEDEAPETIAAIPPPEPPPPPKAEVKPEIEPVAKPKPKAKAKAKAKVEPRRRVAARTSDDARRRSSSSSSVASSAASGVGRGRSDLSTNYRGLVAAHLARHKRFPADARASGQQGSTSVSFTIDRGGRVTSVRLGRGSGIASLDQETTAMVRRASPFPAPPNGQSMTFSVPVSFFLR